MVYAQIIGEAASRRRASDSGSNTATIPILGGQRSLAKRIFDHAYILISGGIRGFLGRHGCDERIVVGAGAIDGWVD